MEESFGLETWARHRLTYIMFKFNLLLKKWVKDELNSRPLGHRGFNLYYVMNKQSQKLKLLGDDTNDFSFCTFISD